MPNDIVKPGLGGFAGDRAAEGGALQAAPQIPGRHGKADLLQEMKVTKGCRFNSAKRLERRDKRMITITAFASVYVILLTMLPLFFHVTNAVAGAVNAITIIFSLVILASSLLQYSNNDPVKAEQHHRCALEVNALRRALRAMGDDSAETIVEFGKKYDDVLQKYGLNHDDIDFDKYKAEHPYEYPPSVSELEKKEVARRVGRAEQWTTMVVGAMSVVAALIATAAAYPLDAFVRWIRNSLGF